MGEDMRSNEDWAIQVFIIAWVVLFVGAILLNLAGLVAPRWTAETMCAGDETKIVEVSRVFFKERYDCAEILRIK